MQPPVRTMSAPMIHSYNNSSLSGLLILKVKLIDGVIESA